MFSGISESNAGKHKRMFSGISESNAGKHRGCSVESQNQMLENTEDVQWNLRIKCWKTQRMFSDISNQMLEKRECNRISFGIF
jgi:hypothetical protein